MAHHLLWIWPLGILRIIDLLREDRWMNGLNARQLSAQTVSGSGYLIGTEFATIEWIISDDRLNISSLSWALALSELFHIWIFLKTKWPTPLGLVRFSRDFIPDSTKGYFFGLNSELHRLDTFLRFEASLQLQIKSPEKPGLICYLWTKICWKQFYAGQLFWIDDS